MKNYISINVVSQSLLFIRCLRKNNCCTKAEIKQLRFPYGVDAEISEAFAIQNGWLYDNGTFLTFTKTGEKIERLFNGVAIGNELWKTILFTYISACSPIWAARIPYGRKEAFFFMNEEEQRCFFEAGLMDSQEDDTLKWWDSLSELERLKSNAVRDDIGRIGEKLTMKYEEERTGVKPGWQSIETNLSGYDILSQYSSSDCRQLLIEVKSSTRPLEKAEAIISRHEWDTAILDNNVPRYLFYLWSVESTVKRLAIITVAEMSCHIPSDRELGKWKSVSVPFDVFAERFVVWNPN